MSVPFGQQQSGTLNSTERHINNPFSETNGNEKCDCQGSGTTKQPNQPTSVLTHGGRAPQPHGAMIMMMCHPATPPVRPDDNSALVVRFLFVGFSCVRMQIPRGNGRRGAGTGGGDDALLWLALGAAPASERAHIIIYRIAHTHTHAEAKMQPASQRPACVHSSRLNRR